PEDAATLLRADGIEFAEIVRSTLDGAVAAAPRIGYPLVVKAVAPGLNHKRDVDGVELGIETPEMLADAVSRLAARLDAAGHRLGGVLLQRQVSAGMQAHVEGTGGPTLAPPRVSRRGVARGPIAR